MARCRRGEEGRSHAAIIIRQPPALPARRPLPAVRLSAAMSRFLRFTARARGRRRPRGGRRGRRRRLVARATAAAAVVAVRIRRRSRRVAALGGARPRRRGPLAESAAAGGACARVRNADRAIKAGNYELAAGVTLPQLLDKLVEGDVTQTSFTVVEGSTFAALRKALAANPSVAKTVLDLSDAELMKRIGAPGASGGLVLSRHLLLFERLDRCRAARARLPADARTARRGVARAARRTCRSPRRTRR